MIYRDYNHQTLCEDRLYAAGFRLVILCSLLSTLILLT
jgi:hypothetical protein